MNIEPHYIDSKKLERALRFRPSEFLKLYRNVAIDPFWLPDGRHFWYRHETAQGHRFVKVDAATGESEAAFDHGALAAALAAEGYEAVSPDALPLDWLRYGPGKTLTFKARKRTWTFSDGMLSAQPKDQLPEAGLPSPDGRWALIQRDGNLILHDVANGAQRALTRDGAAHFGYGIAPGSNLEPVTQERSGRKPFPIALWSPDSKRIITFRLDERKVREVHISEARPSSGEAWPKDYSFRCSAPGDAELATAELLIFDIPDGACRPVQHTPLLITRDSPLERGSVWWCDDSRSALFLDIARGDKSYDVLRLDTVTGNVRKLWTEENSTYVEANTNWWDPIGFPIRAGAEFLLLSERDGWQHLYRHNGESGAPIGALTSGNWVVREIVRIDEAAERVFFLGSGREADHDPYFVHLYVVNFDGTGLRLLTPEAAEHRILIPARHPYLTWRGYPDFAAPMAESLSPDGKYVVDCFATLDTVPTTLIRDVETGASRAFVECETSALVRSGWRWPIPFSVKSADGKYDIYGAVWLPTDYDPKKRYPVIDSIYPGPQTIRTPKFSLQSSTWAASAVAGPATLAELGFIVVTVDGTGGPFRSKAFHDISYQKMERAGGLEDHIAAIRALAERYTGMDLDRVGIFGFSGGGTATARALFAYPDFYKAGVAAAGSHDLMGYTAYWGEKYHGLYDKGRYDRANNAAIAHNLKGKLLLIAGELDDNCHPAMTLQVADALQRAGKSFELCIMTGHNHMTPGGSPYFTQRIWDFFVRHLLGQELPPDFHLT
jgi:dipeptidyl aminopeptidase/acylaminoacyl peptidase